MIVKGLVDSIAEYLLNHLFVVAAVRGRLEDPSDKFDREGHFSTS